MIFDPISQFCYAISHGKISKSCCSALSESHYSARESSSTPKGSIMQSCTNPLKVPDDSGNTPEASGLWLKKIFMKYPG